jgi:hypothetical protein
MADKVLAERVGFEPTVRFAWWITRRPARLVWWTAPVSHQKRPLRNATNAINLQRKYNKINEAGRYPAAHNGLVAGSRFAGQFLCCWTLGDRTTYRSFFKPARAERSAKRASEWLDGHSHDKRGNALRLSTASFSHSGVTKLRTPRARYFSPWFLSAPYADADFGQRRERSDAALRSRAAKS